MRNRRGERVLTVSLMRTCASSKNIVSQGYFSPEKRKKNGPQTSISVAMYFLFASVLGIPLCAFHASLSL